MRQRLHPGDHADVALSMNNVAYVKMSLGHAAEAEPLYVQSLEMRRRLFKGDNVDVASGLNNLAHARQILGRPGEVWAPESGTNRLVVYRIK